LTLSDSAQLGDSEHVAGTNGALAPTEAVSPVLDPDVAALCLPLSDDDPCGPDLDLLGDAEYLNFLAQVEGVLPTSFFSVEDGKPFDPSAFDLEKYLAEADKLYMRSRDIRLLVMRARLFILNRDIAGFSLTLAVIAEWLEKYWDAVHPRPDGEKLTTRQSAITALDLPTVIFPLQYAPLFEGRRIGPVTYRAWIIATGGVKARGGDGDASAAAISEAIANADPAVLSSARKSIALLDRSVQRICKSFAERGVAVLDSLPEQLRKMRAWIDPHAATDVGLGASAASEGDNREEASAGLVALTSIREATQALAAIAEYYAGSEPSSPVLPLVRQAHQLIGKSFLEIMTVLVPTHVDKAAFQIGTNPVFDLPVGKLSSLSATSSYTDASTETFDGATDSGGSAPSTKSYRVLSRAQALAMLESVQRYFRHTEPSSPVPMLCERARALAERDFMGVLEDVLPKSALKAFNADR
jgi:type VI secretion system protein ImpA